MYLTTHYIMRLIATENTYFDKTGIFYMDFDVTSPSFDTELLKIAVEKTFGEWHFIEAANDEFTGSIKYDHATRILRIIKDNRGLKVSIIGDCIMCSEFVIDRDIMVGLDGNHKLVDLSLAD